MSKKHYIYQETTEWNEKCPNNIYIFKDKPAGRTATCLGYVKAGTKEVIRLRTPLSFDLKGRTFEELK
jgi:hypothetical protein